MIDLSNMQAVQFRVAALEKQFLHKTDIPHSDFQKRLEEAVKAAHAVQKNATVPSAVTSAEQADSKNEKIAKVMNAGDNKQLDADLARRIAAKVASVPNMKNKEVSTEGYTSDNLQELIEDAAKEYQLDPKLISAVAEVESGGNQSAISEAGAIGVMQLMPSTANALGVDPYDKKQNIEGGAKYLKEMLETFDGDLTKAVAAYNAGPQAVKAYGGVPPYRETQNYVDKVLDIYQ